MDPRNAEELGERLAELVTEHRVAGAALGILDDGNVIEAAAGTANLNTGVEVTTDTAFQIGSTTKTMTATVLMQLVDEALVDVDATVKTYLPGFAVADPEVSEAVTVRHLLSHTSGIDGDHFEDFGRGDDSLERYVASCTGLHQIHPLGATMSYCNTGFSILGRITEVVTGQVWDQAMKERLFRPAGLSRTHTLPEEAILHRVAAGHVASGPDEPLEVAPVWVLTRSCGPAGSTTSATVGDLLTFARLHLDEGRTVDGTQLVSAASITAMREPQVEIPDPTSLGSHWGLGMILFDWGGRRLYGHDGGTIGQQSRLRFLPEENLAIALVINGGGSQDFTRAVFDEILPELAGVSLPPLPQPPATAPDLDLSRYAGRYQRLAVSYDLTANDGHLEGTISLSGPLAEVIPEPDVKIRLEPIDAGTFLVYEEGEPTPDTAVFYQFEDGVPRYLHNGGRANPRVEA
jgi:CubicO group peptidase (beta-lactamase class C family)